MSKINSLLISIDFRSNKGGISRVANLINNAMPFNKVYSLHGKGRNGKGAGCDSCLVGGPVGTRGGAGGGGGLVEQPARASAPATAVAERVRNFVFIMAV